MADVDLILPLLREIRERLDRIELRVERLELRVTALEQRIDERFSRVDAMMLDAMAQRFTTNAYVLNTSSRHESEIAAIKTRIAQIDAQLAAPSPNPAL